MITFHTVLYVIVGFGLATFAALVGKALLDHYRAKGDWRRGLPDAELDPTADSKRPTNPNPVRVFDVGAGAFLDPLSPAAETKED